MNPVKYILIILLVLGSIYGQGFNHPELEWETIEGEHFIVHYHQNTSWTANEALHVADDIYPAITSLYKYEPEEKTHLIIRDTDDYANGGAYYFDNKIEIWAKPLDYELRGSHYWLRDVITHEFTHIISLRASRKMPGSMPAAYLQVISYEPERREDVLYGYPNGIASYPLPSVSVPMWWAEGIAQFQSDSMRWDWWDSIRDMIIRDRINYDNLLTLSEMDGFGKVGIGNESVYDHGFGLVRYIAEEYGQEILQRITDRISGPVNYSFYRALEAETGIPSQVLWEDWKNAESLRQAFSFKSDEDISRVKFVQREGDGNYNPRWNSSGSSLGFISSAGETYLSRTALFVRDSSSKAKKLILGAEGFDWSPDGDHIVYARKEFYNGGIPDSRVANHSNHHFSANLSPNSVKTCERCNFLLSGSRFSDLFVTHRDSLKDEIQLTFGERVSNPSWSPDGEKIAFVNLRDGTNNLCLAFPAFPDSVQQLTFFNAGTQIYSPRWSPDGRSIIFDYTEGSNRDVAFYDSKNNLLVPLLNDIWDERNPVFKDNHQILYSDDRTGVFNIYSYDIVTGENLRLTNVLGGAFQAEWKNDQLYYSLYDSLGFNIAVLEEAELLQVETEALPISTERIVSPSWEAHSQSKAAHDYTMQYGPMFILPKLQIEIDNNKNDVIYKPGFYFFSDEIISNYSMVGGFGMAANKDLDLFLSSQYRGFLPTLTFEFYQMTRHTNETLWFFESVYPIEGDLTFSLTQGIIAASVRIPPMSTLKLDISRSNYKTAIGSYTISGNPVPGISYDYFKGWDWGIEWDMAHIAIRQERGINPSGYKAKIALRDNHHMFLNDLSSRDDSKYSDFRYLKLNATGFYGYRLPIPGKMVLSNTTEIALIDNNGIDDFFYEFAGGLPGLKGYPFYSMKGSRRVISTSSLRLPIFRENYSRVGHLTVRDLYLGFHGQIGAAWSADPLEVSIDDFSGWMKHEVEQIDLVRDVGVDLRLALNSYYAFPTAFEFGAFYGLDEFDVTINDKSLTYGGEWRYYWKVLFGFD